MRCCILAAELGLMEKQRGTTVLGGAIRILLLNADQKRKARLRCRQPGGLVSEEGFRYPVMTGWIASPCTKKPAQGSGLMSVIPRLRPGAGS